MATAINSTLFASGNERFKASNEWCFLQFTTSELTFVATDAHKLANTPSERPFGRNKY